MSLQPFFRMGVVTLAGLHLALPAVAEDAGFPAASTLARLMPAEQPDDCRLVIEEGTVRIDRAVTNPAMSCPDTVGWQLFANMVAEDFVLTWAGDAGTTFPAQPLPICSAEIAENCCPGDSLDGRPVGPLAAAAPGTHCPWLPGTAQRDDVLTLNLAPTSKAHFTPVLERGAVETFGAAFGGAGRELRQEAVETVHRNEPMVRYILENSLYHKEGTGAVFSRAQTFLSANAPFRAASEPGAPATIEFPITAIMGKAQWATSAQLAAIGVDVAETGEWITARMADLVPGDFDRPPAAEEVYYLLGFHISSKDIPNWVWATFEHEDLPGRCDYVGCLDRYGFAAATSVDGAVGGYTPPQTRNDGLEDASLIFALNGHYPSGAINPELAGILDEMGIGTGTHDPDLPLAADPAWLNYRLKGVQVDYVTPTGFPTLLANAVIEGGFVANSSCMTCHARAAVDGEGHSILGVFDDSFNSYGYARSNSGTPNPDWFQASGTTRILGVQTDFVWGLPFLTNALWDAGED